MSLYIPGLNLPSKDTNPITMMVFHDGSIWRYNDDTEFKAIEVPPHGRLVDVSKLPFNEVRLDEYGDWWMNVEDIEAAPTIIPADGADKEANNE